MFYDYCLTVTESIYPINEKSLCLAINDSIFTDCYGQIINLKYHPDTVDTATNIISIFFLTPTQRN